jgi:hypothetical protein
MAVSFLYSYVDINLKILKPLKNSQKILHKSTKNAHKNPQKNQKKTSFHIKKINEKNTFLDLTCSKIIFFSKFKKQMII